MNITRRICLLCLFVLSFTISQAQQTSQDYKAEHLPNATLGVGFGLPYGWAGFNLEIPVYRRLFVPAGGGLIFSNDPYAQGFMIEPCYNIGLGVGLAKPFQLWQPKLLALYGINGFAAGVTPKNSYEPIHRKTYRGVTLGLSNAFMFGKMRRNGFSVDVLYIVSSGFYAEHEDKYGRFKIGLAYKHGFVF